MPRAFVYFAASSLLLAAVGCDLKLNITPPPPVATPAPAPGPPPETNNALIQAKRAGDRAALTMQLQQLAILAFNAQINNQEFHKDWDAALAADATFYQGLKDEGVVVIWDAGQFERQVGPSNTIVAYGPWVLQEGGPVATIDGRASQMTAEDLKAKLEAMGKLPAPEATPAAATPEATPAAETPAPPAGS